MSTPLLLSLRPLYADLVFEGLKHAELRRRFTRYAENRDVFIYVTSPVQEVRGGFRVEHVWTGTPADIWKEVSSLAGIRRKEFDAYYKGREIAYALKIADVWEYERPFDLDSLRRSFGAFVVPQSWRHLKPEEQASFRTRRRRAGRQVVRATGSASVGIG